MKLTYGYILWPAGERVMDQAYWTDLWKRRELIFFLAWRDFLVRYKQTAVGIAWTILKPLATMVIYTFVFGIIARLPSNELPYALLVLTGLLPWQLFSVVLSTISESMLANAHLIGKVYFPRLILPISSLFVCVVDHLISFILVVLLMLWYGILPGWQILLLPLVTVLATLSSFGLGLILATLNSHYRDFRHLIPLALQLGVFVSPVAYSTNLVPEKWMWLYALNPVVGIIDAFRWCILNRADMIYPPSIVFSAIFSIVTLYFGIRQFRRSEATLIDVM
ncbi:MAG: ABC transporter permease [Pseudomonadota bacterium]